MIKKTLYFGNPAYLSLRGGQLVIKLPEVEKNADMPAFLRQKATRTIPIEDIGVVVLDNRQITLTQGLMAALLDAKVALITCDEQRMPVGLMLPLRGNSVQNERFRQQIEASQPLRKQLWQQTVKAKIANQAHVLGLNDAAQALALNRLVDEVRSGDPDNVEAQAAAYYWKHVFVDQPDFTRGQEGDPPNHLLNYGYAILRAVVARALVGSGLLPVYGIHHHNRYNDYCLADDIMEPYRPFVDRHVIDIMSRHEVGPELTRELKQELLSIPVIDVRIDGRRSPLMIAAGQTTASLAKCFGGEIRKVSYPTFD